MTATDRGETAAADPTTGTTVLARLTHPVVRATVLRRRPVLWPREEHDTGSRHSSAASRRSAAYTTPGDSPARR